MNETHIPVLLDKIITHLCPTGRPVARLIDGTLGAGGHTKALLESGVLFVLGLDIDQVALSLARQRLLSFAGRVHVMQSGYYNMNKEAAALGWKNVDAILLDLGVSSMQVDAAERGFSFMQAGPLDMRFDQSGNRPPASELINHWDENELAHIFHKYGEERHSRRIARAIVKNRPFEKTTQLAQIIKESVPYIKRKKQAKGRRIHPATRVFQALRIAVNDELGVIEQTLPQAIDLLSPGGRLAVISFHSLEDRIVKRIFKEASIEIISPPGMVLEEKIPTVRLITRKPLVADESEITQNPRSRSAKLRVIEKL